MQTLLGFLVFGFSMSSLAESTLVAYSFPDGALGISVLDDPAETPHGAGQIWSTIKGTAAIKKIAAEDTRIHCETRLTAESHRFGQCNFILSQVELVGESFVTEVRGSKAAAILAAFVGDENPSQPQVTQVKLAGEDFWLLADHQRQVFRIEMAKRRWAETN